MTRTPNEADLLKFGAVISQQRRELDLSLREVAAAVDITAPYLGVLEKGVNPKTGKPSQPSLAIVFALARVLSLDAAWLATLAGHEVPTGGEYSPAVAQILARRKIPSVFQTLREVEKDFGEFMNEIVTVEAPIFAVLAHLDRTRKGAPDLNIVGRTFRAGTRPAKLYTLRTRVDEDKIALPIADLESLTDLSRPLSIAVLGQQMSPTVLLLRRLRLCGTSFEVRNSEIPELSFEYNPEDDDQPKVSIEVVYSDEVQAAFLKRQLVDLALFVQPFRLVDDEEHHQYEADLWTEYRASELPMNLVVTLPIETEGRRLSLVQRMDAIANSHRAVSADKRQHGRDEVILVEGAEFQGGYWTEPVLEPFADPYVSDPDELAEELSILSKLGQAVGVLKHHHQAARYRPLIVEKDQLTSRTFEVASRDAAHVIGRA